MKDFIITLLALIVIFIVVVLFLIIISNFKYETWRIGIGEKPIWVKCGEVKKLFPEFDEKYVIKEFKAGRLNHLFEKGWDDFAAGAHLDGMEYLILYYPLADYATLEVTWAGDFFNEDCTKGQWPPKIYQDESMIWYMGGLNAKNARGKSYEWLKKHPEFWRLERIKYSRESEKERPS